MKAKGARSGDSRGPTLRRPPQLAKALSEGLGGWLAARGPRSLKAMGQVPICQPRGCEDTLLYSSAT